MKKQVISGALGVVAVASLGLPSVGQLAADSYVIGSDPAAGEYVDGTPLKDQPSGLVTPGFNNGGYTSGTGTSQFSATSNGLEYAPLNEFSATSGKVNYNAAGLDGFVRTNARNLSGVGTSSTYWISHLVNRGSIPGTGGGGYALTGFGNTVAPVSGATTGFLEGLYVGFSQTGDPSSFGDLVIRSRTTAAQTAEDTVLIDGATTSTFGTTYAVVMKVDVNDGGGSVDNVSWWVNPTNFTDASTLDATALASGSFSSFAFGGGSLARLNYSAQNWNGNVFFDGAQLSSDLAGLGGVIPEPTSLALLGVGGVALLARRRRA